MGINSVARCNHPRTFGYAALTDNGLRVGAGIAFVAVGIGGGAIVAKVETIHERGPASFHPRWQGYAGGTVVVEQMARYARADLDKRPLYIEAAGERFTVRL